MSDKPKKALWKRWWVWVGGIIVIIIIAANAGGGGGATPAAAAGGDSTGNTSTSTAAKAAPKTAKIGQLVAVGKFAVTVNKVTYKKSIDDGTGTAPSANGGTWMIVNVTVKNNDNKSRTLDTSMFTVLKGSTSYDASGEADMYVNGNNSFFLAQLNPGLSQTGNIAFDVPSSTAAYQLKVDGGILFSTASTIINLN